MTLPGGSVIAATLKDIYAMMDAGQSADALKLCLQLLPLQPNHVEILFVLAGLQQCHGRTAEAVSTYQRILTLEPTLIEAEYNLGLLYHQTGASDAAEKCYRSVIGQAPAFAAAYMNLGGLLMERNSFQTAADVFAAVIDIEPDNAGGFFNSGRCLFELGRYEPAAACFQKAAELRPENSRAWHNLGLTHQKVGSWEKAVSCLQRAIDLSPENADLYFDMGNVHFDLGNTDAVIQWYRRGVAHAPTDLRRAENLALLLHEQGHYDEALACYRDIIKCDPANANAHFNQALLLLRAGNFEEGWKEYEWRLKLKNWKSGYPWRIDQPRWYGENFRDKTLLVHCEQGFGDCLQFARYLPMVKARGGTVVFEVPDALKRIFEKFPGVDRLRSLAMTAAPEINYDLHTPLLSLPGIFNTRAESIPCRAPYLSTWVDQAALWQNHSANELCRVGVVWAGSKVHLNDKKRSCSFDHFGFLKNIPGVRLYSLQTELSAEQVRLNDPAGTIIHWGDRFRDFADTAAAISTLDLIISVDTAIVHLAGAMGKPTWVLLPYVPDWRWQCHRQDNPWYPSIRLFRQSSLDNWDSVFEQVWTALDQFVKKQRLT